jgi:hypothetical protein
MRQPKSLALFFVLLIGAPCWAATREAERPDREMLRMMEFLREMEMLKQMEMMREMQDIEHVGEPLPGPAPHKAPPLKKKETPK